jgi:hypothetical protein
MKFKLKCVLCGHTETKEVPAGLTEGPPCARCLGPVTVVKVLGVKPREPEPRTGSGFLRNRRSGRE